MSFSIKKKSHSGNGTATVGAKIGNRASHADVTPGGFFRKLP